MPLETANYIFDLVPTNPPDTDLVQQGDDHIRLIKKVIQQTWPGLTGPNLPTSTGSANAQVVTHVYGPAAYVAGQIVTFKAGFTNTGPTTINVNGGGPVTLSQGGAALTAGAVVAGNNYTMIYDPSVTGFALIASSMGYLPLSGGTLTGGLIIAPGSGAGLTINGAVSQININKPAGANANNLIGQTAGTPRWNLQLGSSVSESGSNAGSDFTVNRYSDAGAFIDSPLAITRSTGATTLSGALSIAPASGNASTTLTSATGTSVLVLNKAVGGFTNQINGQRASVNRWVVMLGNTQAEPGSSNSGSDFEIDRCTDAGAVIDAPLIITRATGQVAIRGTSTNDSAAAGYVGEVVSISVGSPGVTVPNTIATNVTSISLTAGDWDVYSEFWFQMGAGGASACLGSVSLTSAVLAGNGVGAARVQDQATQPAGGTLVLGTRPARISIAATTTVYMVVQINYPSGTCTCYGNMWARRMR